MTRASIYDTEWRRCPFCDRWTICFVSTYAVPCCHCREDITTETATEIRLCQIQREMKQPMTVNDQEFYD